MKNLISIDFEEWYTSAYLRHHVPKEEESPMIKEAVRPVLKLFEKHNTTATFFVIGSVAEKHPEIIEEINGSGHEIASHGYSHKPLFWISKEELSEEVQKTNKILEKISKEKVIGFRAPYFSIDRKRSWGLDVLKKEGFSYDSSIFPAKTPLYGAPGAPLKPYKPSRKDIYKHDESEKLVEYPLTVYKAFGGILNIPICGGFYGRMLPAGMIKSLAKNLNRKGQPLNFYFHPWETYEKTPRLDVSLKNRFITYTGMKGYLKKINYLLKNLSFECFRDNYERDY